MLRTQNTLHDQGVGVRVPRFPDDETLTADTDADGHYEIDSVPVNDEIIVSFAGAGSLPTSVSITTDERPEVLDIALFSSEQAASRDAEAGVTRNPARGALSFLVVAGGLGTAGVSVRIGRPSEGPFYARADRTIDPAATQTSERGFGYFANVEPGEVGVVVEGRSCTSTLLGWPTNRAMVQAGFETSVIIGCD
jgi:hypothetical protein